MKKKRVVLLSVLVMALMLVGCKPSEEKLTEAENARSQLVQAREKAEETYLDIADTSLRPELDALGVKVAEIEAIDFTKMSDKKIDGVLPTITELTDSYGTVQSKLDGTYNQESAASAEQAKNIQINAYIINKMGFDVKSIILHDITTDTYSGNLIGDENTLGSGYTLMGVKLEINTDSEAWEFIVRNTTDTSFTLPCDSLKEADPSGISLSFEYDNETQTGAVNFGGYFSN